MENRSGSGLVAILITLIISIISSQTATGLQGGIRPQHDKVVVCYMSSWATWRKGRGEFSFNQLHVEHCTHLIYAFAGLNVSTSSIRSIDPYGDLKDEKGRNGYGKATGLRNRYPGLKVTIAIGGWNEGSANYSELAASPERRRTFVNSALQFVKKYDFDGLDLDWEFPTQRGGAPHDKQNFVSLVKELSNAFKKHRLLLTAAVGAGINTINEAYDIPELSKYLDFIHIMAYDYHGAWNHKVLANAPLHRASDQLTVEDSVEHLLKQGAPPEKLVLGLPMYGRTFVLTSALESESESPVGKDALSAGFRGPQTNEDGFMAYYEICTELADKTKGWRKGWDDASATPWAIKDDKVIMYDNPKSMMMKADFASKMHLAGVMVWSIDTDDFHGDCADLNNYGSILDPLMGLDYPLMRSINLALAKSPSNHEDNNNLTQNEENSPGSAYCITSPSGAIILSIISIIYFK